MNDLIKNQNVKIIKLNNYYRIEANQETSTPGIYKIFNIDPNKNYNIKIIGYKSSNSIVKLWITNINNNINIIFSNLYQLSTNQKIINFFFENKNKLNKIKVGLLFINPKKNHYFVLKDIQVTNIIENKKKNIKQIKKILIFTDSRGQHKPAGSNHLIYGERLKNNKLFDAKLYLCPYKWTTTLDFIDLVRQKIINVNHYDYIILHTGIVEHSPRSVSQAINLLYDNKKTINLQNLNLNTTNYGMKIINNKKKIFDDLLGEDNIKNYFNKPFSITYNNEKTINMLSKKMLLNKIIPELEKIKNLIWISSNNIVNGWNGDYFRERPKNIKILEEYSRILVKNLPNTINLHKWTDNEIKKFTCDNMHLTKAGSDFLYNELIKKLK